MKYSPTDLARPWSFVREHGGQNNGVFVRSFQQWGTAAGIGKEAWCADFVSGMIWVAFQGVDVPFPRSSAANDFYARAKMLGWLTETPVKDDLFVIVNDADHAHHIGIVTDVVVDPMNMHQVTGIAGNTNGGGSDNGDGVYEKHITHATTDSVVYLHYPRGI